MAAAPTIEVRLSRPDRTYSAGETVSGVVILNSPAPVAHNGLIVKVSGVVYPTLDPRTTGLLEALYSSLKPIEILSNTVELFGPGKLPGGVGFPFEFPVEALPGKSLTETYHGVYVTVKYTVTAELSRGRMQPPLENRVELIVEVPVRRRVEWTRGGSPCTHPLLRGALHRRRRTCRTPCPCPLRSSPSL